MPTNIQKSTQEPAFDVRAEVMGFLDKTAQRAQEYDIWSLSHQETPTTEKADTQSTHRREHFAREIALGVGLVNSILQTTGGVPVEFTYHDGQVLRGLVRSCDEFVQEAGSWRMQFVPHGQFTPEPKSVPIDFGPGELLESYVRANAYLHTSA